MTGGVLTSNPYFPRFGYCQYEQNFKVGQGYVQEVQCALVVNAYNEKAYLMAYFWLLFLSILTFLNAVYTIFYYIVPFTREFYVKQLLKVYQIENYSIYAYSYSSKFSLRALEMDSSASKVLFEFFSAYILASTST
jgi:hypothetical protein